MLRRDRKNAGKKSVGRNWTGMISDVMDNRSKVACRRSDILEAVLPLTYKSGAVYFIFAIN